MEGKRKKIIAYLHPSIYPKDKLTQQYVEGLPMQVCGGFYRKSIICGAALSSVYPRLDNLISGFFNGEVTVENVIKLIEQVTGYQSKSADTQVIPTVTSRAGGSIKPEVKLTEKKRLRICQC